MEKLYKDTNYQIAFYNGKRRSYMNSRGIEYAQKHIDYINNHIPDIGLVSFIINKSDESIDNELVNFINDSDTNFNYEIILRENKGFSYGAWEEVMRKNYKDYDYSFIIEDDYIPSRPDTLKYFYRKFSQFEDCIYVCSLWNNEHASISNGMIKTKLFKEPDNLKILKVYSGSDYKNGINNQRYFMNEFIKKYSFTDITDIGHTIFYRYTGGSRGNNIVFNDSNLPLLLEPI